MKTYTVTTTAGTAAQLWSNDTYTLHFGAGFETECESTPEDLAAAVTRADLARIVEVGDSNDQSKARAAMELKATEIKYEVRTEGASQAIMADSLEDAIAQAEEWLREGWDTTDETIWVHGYLIEMDADAQHRVEVEIQPEEPKCEDVRHDWQSPLAIVGGIKENPGVWGHGGGVTIQEVCVRCGCGKLTDTWAQDPETGREGLRSVKYEPGKYADACAVQE